jgi:hypothetical protein
MACTKPAKLLNTRNVKSWFVGWLFHQTKTAIKIAARNAKSARLDSLNRRGTRRARAATRTKRIKQQTSTS